MVTPAVRGRYRDVSETDRLIYTSLFGRVWSKVSNYRDRPESLDASNTSPQSMKLEFTMRRYPTVVSAVCVGRSQSEALVRTLIEHGVDPIVEKSSDSSPTQISAVLDDLHVSVWSVATWTGVPSSARGLIAIEAVKNAIERASTPSDDRRNCLILLDGRALNYGNEPSILRSKTEILDSYFEKQNGVAVSVATLERADRRYPEVTIADFVCRHCVDRIDRDCRFGFSVRAG